MDIQAANAPMAGDQLYEVNAGDLGAEDLVGAYEDAYQAAMVRIRAVSDVMSRGKKPKNLRVAIASIEQNAGTMRKVHNQVGPLLAEESHWICGRPRSEVMRSSVYILDWTISLAAIGISAADLRETENATTSMSVARSVATLGVGAMHVIQGWFSGKTFEQIAYEQDLFDLIKGSAGRIRYVESMIQTFSAWERLQEHESSGGIRDIKEEVQSLISALEAVPVKAKSAEDKGRRDILEAFVRTRRGMELFDKSEQLQEYRRLVEKEYHRGESTLVDKEVDEEPEDVMADDETELNACDFLKQKKKKSSPIRRIRNATLHSREDMRMERRSSPIKTRASSASEHGLTADVLDEFVASKFCFFVNWDVNALVNKINGKYRIVETEAAAVGSALQKHGATEIDFETSMSSLQEVYDPILELEKVAQYILSSDKGVPTAANFRSQQAYRTIIQLVLTGGSFVTSTAESILEFKNQEPNATLKAIAFAALLGGQLGARWDNYLQGKVFSQMRVQQLLRGTLAKKHSQTIAALIKYWRTCQTALTTGNESDVERAFATRVPKPIALTCSINDVAMKILSANRERGKEVSESREIQPAGKAQRGLRRDASIATSADEEEEEGVKTASFDQKVISLAQEAERKSQVKLSLGVPLTPTRQKSPAREGEARVQVDPHQMLWAEVDSEEDALPEGDWEFRLSQLDKHEQRRRQRRASNAPQVQSTQAREGVRAVTFDVHEVDVGASAALDQDKKPDSGRTVSSV